MKSAFILSGLLSLILAVALYLQHRNAGVRLQASANQTAQMSNQWEQARVKLAVQETHTERAETNLFLRTWQLAAASNKMAQLQLAVGHAQAESKLAMETLKKRETEHADLESKRLEAAKQNEELSAALDSLRQQITALEKKLATADDARDSSLDHARRLEAEQDELITKFNDLKTILAQAAKLKGAARQPTNVGRASKLELQADGTVRIVPVDPNDRSKR